MGRLIVIAGVLLGLAAVAHAQTVILNPQLQQALPPGSTLMLSLSTPTAIPTSTSTPTPTPTASSTPAGLACVVSVNSPNPASRTVSVAVSDVCPAGLSVFNRLYITNPNGAITTHDFNTNSSFNWNTAADIDGAYTLMAIAWDTTGLVVEGRSPTISVTVANGSSTPTPSPTPTVSPSPTATPTPGGVSPLGVAAPAGKTWHTTLDDEFAAPSINTSQWNYGYSNDHNCRASGCVEGQQCAGSDVNHQRCNDDFNFAHDTVSGGILTQIPSNNNGTGEDTAYHWGGMAGLNSAAKFIQRYGYFEAHMKLPPNNAAASGQGSDFWGVPATFDPFNSTDCNGIVGARDEVDIAENSNGGTGVLGTGSQFSVQTTIYDCGHTIASGGFDYQIDMSNGQDLSAAYHTYGLNWLNDGSPEGTMCFYLDGTQKGCHTLSGASVGWANGISLIAYDVYCYPGGILGGGACTGNGTEGLQTDYMRAWQAL